VVEDDGVTTEEEADEGALSSQPAPLAFGARLFFASAPLAAFLARTLTRSSARSPRSRAADDDLLEYYGFKRPTPSTGTTVTVLSAPPPETHVLMSERGPTCFQQTAKAQGMFGVLPFAKQTTKGGGVRVIVQPPAFGFGGTAAPGADILRDALLEYLIQMFPTIKEQVRLWPQRVMCRRSRVSHAFSRALRVSRARLCRSVQLRS
jgi:hypothetical protein